MEQLIIDKLVILAQWAFVLVCLAYTFKLTILHQASQGLFTNKFLHNIIVLLALAMPPAITIITLDILLPKSLPSSVISLFAGVFVALIAALIVDTILESTKTGTIGE